MYGAYPYNPQSTIRVEETVTVFDDKVFLHHIPKEGSVMIDGFTEVDGEPQQGQFSCDYATDSLYRDSNRVLNFHLVDDFTELTVNYIAIGTVLTADIWNEIKAHLENQSIHSGSGKAYFFNNSTKMIAAGGLDFRNIDDEYWAIDSRIGRGLDEAFQSEVGRAPQVGDIVQYYAPGNDVGYTIRTTDKWFNLGYVGENDTSWDSINPLLTIKDRQKLDAFNGGDCEAFFRYAQPDDSWVGDTSSLPFTYHDKSWDSTHYAFADFEQAFQGKCGRPSQLGDIVHWMNTGMDEGYAYRASDKWFNLTDKNNSDGWKKINPLLTENDRKLLDYLHELYDEHIP